MTEAAKIGRDFLGKRNMQAKTTWAEEDGARHKDAQAVLGKMGYVPEEDYIEIASHPGLAVGRNIEDLERKD